MELKNFIDETITQLVEGVIMAQNRNSDNGSVVVPAGVSFSGPNGTYKDGSGYRIAICEIDFSIMLTETSGSESKVGIGVWFSNIGIGANGKADENTTSANTIKFSIPIILPTQKIE